MNFAPQGSVTFAASASARLWILMTIALPLASGPLIITLGSAKYAAAPATSPRRRSSDQPLITATAAASAGIPVGLGAGIPACGPDWVGARDLAVPCGPL